MNRRGDRPVVGDQQVLVASRARWLVVTAMAAAFTLVGVSLVDKGNPAGWVGVVFFGVVVAVGVCSLITPGQLTIDSRHVERRTLGRRKNYELARCDEFTLKHVSIGQTWIEFDYHDPTSSKTTSRQTLPDTYGLPGPDLVQLLNRARNSDH